MRHKSEGYLLYSIEPKVGHKLHLSIDPGIVETYRALVPKAVRLQRGRYTAHISVIRNEPVPNLELWEKYQGEPIQFEYESHIYNDDTYYWLRCFSPALIFIRRELGLPDLSDLARGPDWFASFHCTLGNTKTK